VRYEVRPLVAWTDPETKSRAWHRFSATWSSTLDLLGREAASIGAKLVVIQLDVTEGEIRRDGMLRADAKVGHPGAVVSIDSRFGPLRYAADTYKAPSPAWQANVRAIALSLEALRAVDRWGVSRRGEQYAGWTAIEAPKPAFADWHEAASWMREYAISELHILHAAGNNWRDLYRAMARRMHPDQGAPRAEWDRLDEARRMLAEAGML
jgi:hypothetical protein